MKRPNVLLIMTDQHRFDCLGCYGNTAIDTPNLDHLAAKGTLFTNAYTPSPSCIPARACLMTGQTTWNVGILGMGGGQGPMGTNFAHTLPGELAKAGYHTQGVGKMHFHPQRSLNGFHRTVLDETAREQDPRFISDYRQWFLKNRTGEYDMLDHGVGVNSWVARPYHAPEHLHPSTWTVGESIEFLKKRDPEKPFFLKTSFARPHSPYDAPEYYFQKYLKRDLPKAQVGDWAQVHDVPEEALDVDAWHGKKSDETIRQARAGYYGSIEHIDHQLGRLFDAMKRQGVLDNTIILFTSDHGDMLGDHNLWRKTYAYEGSAHIPMIVCLPKAMRDSIQKRVDAPVTLYDVMPTFLEAAGLEIPDTVDGKSMLSLIYGKDEPWREAVHGEHSTCYAPMQEMQFMTDGKFKYVWLPRIHQEQLFCLENDPYELQDLADRPEYQEELIRWRKRLIAELEPRNAGLTDGDSLVSLEGKPFLVSPKYKERLG